MKKVHVSDGVFEEGECVAKIPSGNFIELSKLEAVSLSLSKACYLKQ